MGTGLKAAASSSWGWGRAFCQSHHVGAFCYGYTRVRCCRNTFGFVQCGSSVHARTCGWHGVWNAGSQVEDGLADVSSDESTDEAGPFLEEPSAHQDANPLPAKANWDNETGLKAAASSSWGWGRAFCQAHHIGAFCHGFTRVRCCRNTFGFVRCGSSVHARTCGWHRGGVWNTGSQDGDAPADVSSDESTEET